MEPGPSRSWSENLPTWDAPLLFEDAGRYPPFRADAWPGPVERQVEVDASVLDGPFAFSIGGRRSWRVENVFDTAAGHLAASRLAGTHVVRFYSTDSAALSTLTTNGVQVAGYFQSRDERWILYPVSGKTHLLVRDDEALLACAIRPPDVTADADPTYHRRHAVRFPTAKGNWDIVQWNLGLWYNPRFAQSVGGDDNARLLTQAFADTQNSALIATGSTYARIALVISEPVGTYVVPGRTDYASVRTAEDGLHLFYNDSVLRQRRYDHKVSIAGYLDAVSDVATGLASPFWGGVPDKNSGTFAAFCGKFPAFDLFVHEIGHTLGLHHDVSSAPSNAHKGTLGFINCRGRVHCAMSSSPDCVAYTQLFYSNPDHIVAGAPFGSDASNAAAVIRNYRFIIRDEFWVHAIEGDL